MRSTSTSRRRNEEGMALLFALGFLAMLLVLGLGFVTTSLLSQKIAVNNATRVQARMLARSAASRAALAIMLYNDQSIVNDINVSSYDGVCSYDQVSYNNNGTAATGHLDDQLKKGTDAAAAASLLEYTAGSADFTGEKSNARWMYFYDSPSGTVGRKIIGRAAFQVLPSSTQWLSLYGVTGGAKLENDLGVIPYKFRWGRGVEELCLDKTKTLEQWSTYAIKTKIPFVYDTLYNTYSDFFTSDIENKKSWIEKWFVEGRNTVVKEAFPVRDATDSSGKKLLYYNRFNIGDRYCDSADRNDPNKDNWYDRFKRPTGGGEEDGWTSVTDEKKNSAEALDALAGEANPYQENDGDDKDLAAAGLPFLKRIGNDPHSFKLPENSDADALELFRRQIAANFNDYCDSDSIPTSNVKASGWSITDSSKYPSYTGNEKTLYINEIAALLPVEFNVKCAKSGAPLTITPRKNQMKLFVELIKMYDDPDGDAKSLLNPKNVKAQVKVESLSFKIALYGYYKVKVTYKKNDNDSITQVVSLPDPITINEDYGEEDFSLKLKIADDAPTAIESFIDASPYSIGSYVADLKIENQSEVEDKFRSKIMEVINNNAPTGYSYKSHQFTDVKIGYRYRDFKVKFSPILLQAKETVSGVVTAGCGIDFVRLERLEEITLENDALPEKVVAEKIIREGWTHTFKAASLFGGLEAMDPRQNLNPSKSGTSDWTVKPQLILLGKWAETDQMPSMTVNTNQENITGGLKNNNANPSAPVDHNSVAIDANKADKEAATDPAWLGAAANQHVSTAYIRNSPMVSPWEVGLIHRGRAWQTLNIKRAGGFGSAEEIKIADIKAKFDNWTAPGTKYENGDGAILEYTKMNTACRAMGKIPLTMLRSEVISKPAANAENGNWNGVETAYNKDIVKMLFDGIRQGQSVKEFFAESKFGVSNPSAQGGTAITTGDTVVTDFIKEIDDMLASDASELKLRSQFLNSDYGANDGNSVFTFGLVTTPNTDAAREELVGKTINLLAVTEETPPNIFRVVVVAQTIRDVGGIDNNAVPITKLHNGEKKTLDCLLGRFEFISDATDWEKNTYFDEITGEVKALVTIERVPAIDDTGSKNPKYGRLVVTKIEYID